MRVGFGSVVLGAGLSAILSFSFLALAVGTEYWYIMEDKRTNHTELQHVHSGLWGVENDEQPFTGDLPSISDSERHMQNIHNVIAVVLPLSLVLLVFGGICGMVSSLARSRLLLMGTASYFLLCSLLTLSGVSLYISYSQKALEEAKIRIGLEQMAMVHTSFGWSMALAWLSFTLEMITGLLLLLAAWMVQLAQYQETVAPI
ncbi:transmembrane protein 235 isoform X2 [Tachysurus fulvidraco]|uniref:transmembrane protein 235 isoform X2 n=1 Tax=Tachysurus fulvidraco TaxID=1234273 RepID=UPI000F4D51FB|nr:transmembrane protein 235 isoform X2 [Tachysurus fulvidraco]